MRPDFERKPAADPNRPPESNMRAALSLLAALIGLTEAAMRPEHTQEDQYRKCSNSGPCGFGSMSVEEKIEPDFCDSDTVYEGSDLPEPTANVK